MGIRKNSYESKSMKSRKYTKPTKPFEVWPPRLDPARSPWPSLLLKRNKILPKSPEEKSNPIAKKRYLNFADAIRIADQHLPELPERPFPAVHQLEGKFYCFIYEWNNKILSWKRKRKKIGIRFSGIYLLLFCFPCYFGFRNGFIFYFLIIIILKEYNMDGDANDIPIAITDTCLFSFSTMRFQLFFFLNTFYVGEWLLIIECTSHLFILINKYFCF